MKDSRHLAEPQADVFGRCLERVAEYGVENLVPDEHNSLSLLSLNL